MSAVSDFEYGPEQYDFREPDEEVSLPSDIQAIVEHLRETLTYDMALRAYRCRSGGEDPRDDAEMELFIEELIAEAVNSEYDQWIDEFLEYD